MDIGAGLVTAIVDEGRLKEVQRQGVKPEFLDEDSGPVLNYIQRYFQEYKGVPSRDAVIESFPQFEFTKYKEPLEFFIDKIKESYRRSVLEERLQRVAGVYVDDTREAENQLRKCLQDLQVTGSSHKDVDVASNADSIISQYLKKKEGPTVSGVPSGWEAMDYQTLGYQKEDFAVLVGKKYMGKSWILVDQALKAMLYGEKVLFNTNEMSTEAVIRRFASIYASVPFDSLRRGELTNVEEKRFIEKMNELKESSHKLIVVREGINTIEDIENKAIEIDATIIFADSVYLYNADSKTGRNIAEPSRRAEVSRRCKKVARNLGVPFIVSVQAGRKKTQGKEGPPDLDDIEWSNSFSQDADTVFFITKDEVDKQLGRMQNWVLKSRDGDLANFFIDMNFEHMKFGQRGDSVEPSTKIEFDEEDNFYGGE